MTERLDTDALAALARPLVGGGAPQLRTIHTGKHNSSYRVEGGPRRLVLRVAPPNDAGLLYYERRMMRQEPELRALTGARTELPVA
jgi:aminoglycoside phosphotransferase (APT) family kinase protein